MLVVPASMTLAATSSNEVVSLGYIVVIDSERLTSSMLLMLEESTVTWISTGLPSNRIEAVYTPGQTDNSEYNKSYYNSSDNRSNKELFKWNNNNFSLTHHKETCPSYSLLQNIWYGVGDYD